MTTTTRTIGEVLTVRRRAAEMRVLECSARALRVQQAIQQAVFVRPEQEEELAKAIEVKRLAEDALALVRREIDAQAGLSVEPVPYDPAGGAELRRYAAVLLLDNRELGLADALTEAHQDEHTRFEDHMERYGERDDLDEDEGDEGDED